MPKPKARTFHDGTIVGRGGLADQMAANLKANRKGKARTFGQDLMRGEHVVGKNDRRNNAANAKVAGGGGGGAWAQFNKDRVERTSLPSALLFGEIENFDGAGRTITGTSIFDPVMAELAYRWFSPPGGAVLDPFAGGSVRGIVAAKLGRSYVGVDLRAEQVAANQKQAKKICKKNAPTWIEGDSIEIQRLVHALKPKRDRFDFVFSCPPYFDLEVYSDDARDISTMPYVQFLETYRLIIRGACALLKDDRFACFVVGDMRDKGGCYRNFPGHTIEAFEAAGLRLYNDAILVTSAGSLAMRVRRQWEASRKLGTTHQRVLVFVKGDPKAATAQIGDCEFGEVGEETTVPASVTIGATKAPADEFGEKL